MTWKGLLDRERSNKSILVRTYSGGRVSEFLSDFTTLPSSKCRRHKWHNVNIVNFCTPFIHFWHFEKLVNLFNSCLIGFSLTYSYPIKWGESGWNLAFSLSVHITDCKLDSVVHAGVCKCRRGKVIWVSLVWAKWSKPGTLWVLSHWLSSTTGDQRVIIQTIILTRSQPVGCPTH